MKLPGNDSFWVVFQFVYILFIGLLNNRYWYKTMLDFCNASIQEIQKTNQYQEDKQWKTNDVFKKSTYQLVFRNQKNNAAK